MQPLWIILEFIEPSTLSFNGRSRETMFNIQNVGTHYADSC